MDGGYGPLLSNRHVGVYRKGETMSHIKRLISANPALKRQTWYHEDTEGNVTIQELQDNTQLFEDNKAILNETSSLDRYGDGRLVLRGVPHRLTEKWKKLGWFEKGQEWRILNDPEAQPYKVFG